MARKARAKSESGTYHIVLKGNNKLLFAEEDDYRYFIGLLGRQAERDYVEVYAFCLFSEIAHLVIKEGLRPIGESLKSLVSAYAVRCNSKYARSGKLFYDRYTSEPIESYDTLIDAVRYVHRIPLFKHEQLDYPYSSYGNYVSKKGLGAESLALLFDGSVMRFKEEMDITPQTKFASGERKVVLTDEQLIELIRRYTRNMSAEEIERITLPVLGELAYKLQSSGASIRQLSRVLDVSKSTVEKSLRIYAESASYD